MTASTQAKMQTRKATMRHTATLEVELEYARQRALVGCNFAGNVEGLLDWQHMGAEWLCSQITSYLQERQNGLKAAREKRDSFGAGVDACKFTDEA